MGGCSGKTEPIEELRVITGSKVPSRGGFMPCFIKFPQCADWYLVFGYNIPYETTRLSSQHDELTGTFTHFPEIRGSYSPPNRNEILHIRDGGYEYLTLERINGVTCITAGTLECLTAELAYPLLARHGKP